jgi:hypothetical protein
MSRWSDTEGRFIARTVKVNSRFRNFTRKLVLGSALLSQAHFAGLFISEVEVSCWGLLSSCFLQCLLCRLFSGGSIRLNWSCDS